MCTQCPLLSTRLLACGYGNATAAARATLHAPSSGPAAVLQSLFQGRLSCSLAAHLDVFWDLSIEIPGVHRDPRRQRHTGVEVDHSHQPDRASSLNKSKTNGGTGTNESVGEQISSVDESQSTDARDVEGREQKNGDVGTLDGIGEDATTAVPGDAVETGVSARPVVDVVMALRNFCAPEMIGARERRLSIWGDPPPVLTLHLKRFWQSQEGGQWRFHKIDAQVHFKESTCTCTSTASCLPTGVHLSVLACQHSLTYFVLDTLALDVREFCDPATRPDNVEECTYTLFSVVCRSRPSTANLFTRCSLDFWSD
jgi:hypothetical protein